MSSRLNYDSITGMVRAIVPAIVAWLGARGVVEKPWLDILITVVVTAGACIWSIINNTSGKTVPSTLSGYPPTQAKQ